MPERSKTTRITSSFFMSDYSSITESGAARKFSWMPTLDGYIMRAFLVPFFILLFAFTLLFIIMDMYNDVGDFLDNEASVSTSIEYFVLKIPGNIRFILPITVLLSCMYALANLGRTRELTAIRASGISLGRCGLPIFIIGFCVMLVNFYFNEQLVPETTRKAELVRRLVNNKNYVEQTNARLQFHSGDRLRSWYFGQFDDDDFQENVKLKFFGKSEHEEKSMAGRMLDAALSIFGYNPLNQNWETDNNLEYIITAERTHYDEKNEAWVFFKPVIGKNVYGQWPYAISADRFAEHYDLKTNTRFSDFQLSRAVKDALPAIDGIDADIAGKVIAKAKADPEMKADALPDRMVSLIKNLLQNDHKITVNLPKEFMTLEYQDTVNALQGKLNLSQGENELDILAFYDNEAKENYETIDRDDDGSAPDDDDPDPMSWKKDRDPVLLVVSERMIPDIPSVIVKSVIEPDALSSIEILTILRDNPDMAANLRRIYWTIFFNRLAFPWACFLCAFFAFPLATKNERSGIFTAIATAVGIAVLYQVLNEVFMVAGKSGYMPPILAGLTPTVVFGIYGICLLKKAG